MRTHTKLLLTVVGVIVMVAVAVWYYSPAGRTAGHVSPVDRDQGTAHGKMEATDPLSAFAGAFETPIVLYGRVEDQHGDPVAGATVRLSPLDAPYRDESPLTTLVCDDKGTFSVKGLHGFSMGVSVRKNGYLDLPRVGGPASSATVEYAHGAEEGKRYSHVETPLVLRLHKLGPLEPLVYVENQRWRLPVDGTAKNIALDSAKGVGPHQIEFRFTSNWNQLPNENESNFKRFDWKLEARIPGGGFVRNRSDYAFEAPESGYEETIVLDHPKEAPKWEKLVNRRYFVKFPDGTHGRIRFSIDGDSDASPLLMTSWMNLKPGSRNLASEKKDGTWIFDD